MQPFLDRFYDEVRKNLSDPGTSKRYTKSERYADLYAVQERIFSKLMAGAGQDSDLNRVEASIAVVSGTDTYALPEGFRQFISFERRVDGQKHILDGYLPSVPTYQINCGMRILGNGRGIQMIPVPTEAWAGTWTLVYRRGPVKLHHATAGAVAVDGSTVTAAAPATDAGELIPRANYYAGCVLRIYSANSGGYPQERVIVSNTGGSSVVFTLDRVLSPVPQGTVKYEICPDLPDSLDSLYAMDVTLLACSRRRMLRAKAGLKQERHELWSAARGYYGDAAADRGPERFTPPDPLGDNPWE